MALGKKRDAIKKWSGGEIQVKEVNSDGTDLETAAAWQTLGFIDQGKLTDTTEEEDIPDETGDTVITIENTRTVKIEALLMQSDKDTLDFISEGCRNKYFALYRKEGTVDKKYQEFFFPIVKIKPSVELAAGTKRPPFTATAYKSTADVTIAIEKLPVGAHTASAVTIAKGKYYSIIETAVA